MRRIAYASLVALILSSGAFAQATPDTPIYQASGRMESHKSRVGGDVSTYETGSISGVFYKIFPSDLSGSFAGTPEFNGQMTVDNLHTYLDDQWNIGCQVDAMTDKKMCVISRKDVSVAVEKASIQIIVGSDHFPGRASSIRIGKNKPFSTNNDGVFSKAASKSIAAQILAGATISTRYVEWPYDSYKDAAMPSFGFKEALDYAKWAVARP